MEQQLKKQYVPCQIDVVEFKVERGFATSIGETLVGNCFTQDAVNNTMIWSMTKDGNENFRNIESYTEENFEW